MPIRITERKSAGERGREHNRREKVKGARLKERIVVERAQQKMKVKVDSRGNEKVVVVTHTYYIHKSKTKRIPSVASRRRAEDGWVPPLPFALCQCQVEGVNDNEKSKE